MSDLRQELLDLKPETPVLTILDRCIRAADEIASLRAQLEAEQGWRHSYFNQRAELMEVRAQIASARKALDRMSEQLLSSQMEEDQRDHADWQGGYDAMVIAARAAKAALMTNSEVRNERH